MASRNKPCYRRVKNFINVILNTQRTKRHHFEYVCLKYNWHANDLPNIWRSVFVGNWWDIALHLVIANINSLFFINYKWRWLRRFANMYLNPLESPAIANLLLLIVIFCIVFSYILFIHLIDFWKIKREVNYIHHLQDDIWWLYGCVLLLCTYMQHHLSIVCLIYYQ